MTQEVGEETLVRGEHRDPSYYAMIPKMAIMDLAPYELALYCQYKQIVGENPENKCWVTQENLAFRSQMGEKRLKEARDELQRLGYIYVDHKFNEHGKPVVIVTVRDVWAINHHRWTTQKEFETGEPNQPPSDVRPSSDVRSSTVPRADKEEPYKKKNQKIKDSTGFVANPVQEKGNWRRKGVVVTPSASMASMNEQAAYTALELYLMKMLKRSSLTAAQRKTLTEDVVVRATDGSTTEYSCPNTLYANDEHFRKYVEKKTTEMLNASNGKASTTNLINAIANYVHAHGWLSYQSALHPVPPPKASEPSTPKTATLVKVKEQKGVFN